MSVLTFLFVLGISANNKEDNYVSEQARLKKEVAGLQRQLSKTNNQIHSIKHENVIIKGNVDSLKNVTKAIGDSLSRSGNTINCRIDKTNSAVKNNSSILVNHTTWGIAIAIIVLIIMAIVAYLITKKINKGTDSIESTIDDVRKTQESLQSAQNKLQEDSVRLDNKMLDIAQKQIELWQKEDKPKASTKPDHSLVLKVADEIVRIELNMSRMDPNIRGYKQLKKAVQRIKDNFKANGYDFVEMLGMPYNEGMKVIANFVYDESLKLGTQIITGITKPQINYNGQMIQAAQITVSQNI